MVPDGSLPHSQVPASCPYPEPARFIPYLRLNIILPSTPGSSKLSLTFRIPQQTLYTNLLSLHVLHTPPISFFSIWSPEQYLVSSIHHKAPLPCYLIPLRPKYSPQHPILKHPQPMFLPQCERPHFTPIQNNRQNYISVYLHLYILGKSATLQI